MAGSLQRPPLKIIIPLHKCNNTSKYKSIIKYQKLRLLRTKRRQHHNSDKISRNSSYQKPQQLQQQLLKQLKYCKSLSWNKLLLLLPSSLSVSSVLYSNDSCWTATENKKYHKILAAAEALAINYVQQQVQQQKQQQHQQLQQQQQQQHHEKQLQLQLLQNLNKVFKSSKFCKNLLNRKKLQQLLLREIQLYRDNQLNKKTF